VRADVGLPLFGDLLRRCRRAAGLSQAALAARAHLSADAISALEQGRRHTPHKETLQLLMLALTLSPAERVLFERAAAQQRESRPRALQGVDVCPRSPVAPMIGRAVERALLQRTLAPGGDTTPPAVFLAGEPGIGLSRLLQHLALDARASGWTVLEGRCAEHDDQDPYAPLTGVLGHAIAGMSALGDPLILRERLQGCAWLVRLLPELGDWPLPPLPTDAPLPAQERRLIGSAILRFLANVAGAAGTLLVLDDLERMPAEALTVLALLVRSCAHSRLRVVGAYQSTAIGPTHQFSLLLGQLTGERLATRCLLGPLRHEEAETLLDALWAPYAGPESFGKDAVAWQRADVLRWADGVPAFLVSFADAVRAGEEPQGTDVVPWDLAQAVRGRVATLPAHSDDLLSLAVVAGCLASLPLLTALATCPEDVVVRTLDAICHAGLLREVKGEGPGITYHVTHEVFRVVILAGLSAARRVTLHRAVARALEEVMASAILRDVPAAEIARHHIQAGDQVKALPWLERAGDRAAAAFDHNAAVDYYSDARERAVACGEESILLSRLDEKIGDIHATQGQHAQAHDHFVQARIRATAGLRRVELRRKEGTTWTARWEVSRALAAFDRAAAHREDAAAPLPRTVRLALLLSRAEAYARQWNPAAMEATVAEAGALLTAATPHDLPQYDTPPGTQEILQEDERHGAISDAEALLHHAVAATAQVAADDGPLAAARWQALGHVALFHGDVPRAEECYRRSMAVLIRPGQQGHLAAVWSDLGCLLLAEEDAVGAEACFQQSLAAYEASLNPSGAADMWHRMGSTALVRGDLAAAASCYQRSLSLMESLREPAGIAWAWSGLAQVACQQAERSSGASRYCGGPRLTAGIVLARQAPPRVQTPMHVCQQQLVRAAWMIGHARALTTWCGLPRLDIHVALPLAALHLHRGGLVQAVVADLRWLAEERILQQGGEHVADIQTYLRLTLSIMTRSMREPSGAAEAPTAPTIRVGTGTGLAAGKELQTALLDVYAYLVDHGAILEHGRSEQLAAAWGLP